MKKIFFIALLFSTMSLLNAQNSAIYDITFTSIWNASDHTSVPSNAHWSKLVGATHKTQNSFLERGELATTGIKNVAETGSNTVFKSEVTTAISNNEADQYIDGPNLSTATGDMTITNLTVSKDFPLVTLVSMIAPSPDWIIALNSYNLQDINGDWITSATLDIFAYDAGTDNGTDYGSANSVTNPFDTISRLNVSPINGNKMGTITITLKQLLDIDKVDIEKEIGIYPNPTSNQLTINTELEVSQINIIDLTGKMIMVNKQNTSTVNVADLPPGIYFIELITANRRVTKKFVKQ